MKKVISLLSLMMLLFLQIGCGDIKLKPYDTIYYSKSASDIQFCTTPADTIKSNLKFIFVVDRSGSNQQRYDINNNYAPLPGTDPLGTRRFDALLRFVDQFQDDPYIYWSMINFASNATVARNFTNDKQAFYNFVQDQKNRTAQIDGGSTDYMSALERLSDLIKGDIDNARNQNPVISSNYVIFFISDGAPIVQGQVQDSNAILDRVTTIAALEKEEKVLVEGIQLNAAYYYTDPEVIEQGQNPRDLLNNMSLQGHGDFFEFASGQEIDFNRFAIPTRISRFALKEIWVTNANSVWWGDKLLLDSDADGLPDEVERSLGSDPFKYDSDNNGVGDGVEYRVSAKPCQDAQCNSQNANPYTTCRSLQVSASPVTYNDSDKDYLNDCEEKLLGSDKDNPDTNHDYVPDSFAFVNQIQLIEGTSDLYTDVDSDGLTEYQELKKNTPVFVNNSQVPGLVTLTYQGQMVSSDSKQDCYAYNLTSLPFHSTSDKIRVFIFENTKSINEKIIFRTGEKTVSPYGTVGMTDADLK